MKAKSVECINHFGEAGIKTLQLKLEPILKGRSKCLLEF